MSNAEREYSCRVKRVPWRILHWAIVANLAAEFAYAGWMVLVVLAPPGRAGLPLGPVAAAIPLEQMVARRLYAIEAWIAFGALSIYLAITEIGPRLREARAAARANAAAPVESTDVMRPAAASSGDAERRPAAPSSGDGAS